MSKAMNNDIIEVFNEDILDIGSYAYTNPNIYSAYIATQKQSGEVIRLLKDVLHNNARILDIGCGDGTFTIELFERVHPRVIVGFDIADKAINKAQKKVLRNQKKKIIFQVQDIYSIDQYFKKNQFDIAIMRGVLHHLDFPEMAIKNLSHIIDNIIILEPNGYNPFLKIIEKISFYHRLHNEKSYWPPSLNKWFIKMGYRVEEQKFFGLVPYFCNYRFAKIMKFIEPIFENVPYLNRVFCGTNIIVFKK